MATPLDAVNALRASMPAPHETPGLRAFTRCSDVRNPTMSAGPCLRSKCLSTKGVDWVSWMARVQVRNRSKPFYNVRPRSASRNARIETGLFISNRSTHSSRSTQMVRFTVARLDELVCYRFTAYNDVEECEFGEESPSIDGGQQERSASKAVCEGDSKHFSPKPAELSRARQDSLYPSPKPAEQPRASLSVSVDTAEWYVNLKRDVIAAELACEERYEEPEPPTAVPVRFALPELSAAMREEVKAALEPEPVEEVLAQGFNLVVRRADMSTLDENQWINDTVINFYLCLLVKRAEEEGSLRVYAFNTFFFTKLCRDGHAGLKRWTRKVDLFSYHIILVPIHMSRHWCLAVVDFRKPQIALYDSFGASHVKVNCIDVLKQYLEHESLHKRNHGLNWNDWKFVMADDAPQQQNLNDCGMFTCQFAECISRDAPFQFTQQHMPYFRKRVVYEILHSTLL